MTGPRVFQSPAALDAAVVDGFRFLPEHGPAAFVCGRCGGEKPLSMEGNGCGTGYATTSGKLGGPEFRCYDCCGEDDADHMRRTGRITLYLVRGKEPLTSQVSNWPGTLTFSARVRKGRHNIARYRYDAWFTGPDGEPWHGVQYGDNTQIIHCRRVKR